MTKVLTKTEETALRAYRFNLERVGNDEVADRCWRCSYLTFGPGRVGRSAPGGHECSRLGHVIANPQTSTCPLFDLYPGAPPSTPPPAEAPAFGARVDPKLGCFVDDGRGPAWRDPDAGVGEGDHQGTPLWLLELLSWEFRFDLDLFATHGNAVAPSYFTTERRAGPELLEATGLQVFANPPYSRRVQPNPAKGKAGNLGANILDAMELVAEVAEANVVVTLTRLEPGAEWFRFIRDCASEVRALDCRLKFRGQPSLYNFPTCVSVWRPRWMREPGPARFVWWDAAAKWAALQDMRQEVLL